MSNKNFEMAHKYLKEVCDIFIVILVILWNVIVQQITFLGQGPFKTVVANLMSTTGTYLFHTHYILLTLC